MKLRVDQVIDGGVRAVPVLRDGVSTTDWSGVETVDDPMRSLSRRLTEMEQQGDQRLAEARSMADRIVQDAEARADDIATQARERGYHEGYTAGRDEGLTAAQAAAERLLQQGRDVVSGADVYRQQLVQGMASALTDIAMASVRRLLHRELHVTAADVAAMVSELLHEVLDSAKVEVRVHPDDFVAATEAHPIWQQAKFGDWDVAIVPDATVAAGGCEVRSELGRLDARMETKLELLQAAVTAAMERSVYSYDADR